MCSFGIWPTVSNMGSYTPISSIQFCGVALLSICMTYCLSFFFLLTAHVSPVYSLWCFLSSWHYSWRITWHWYLIYTSQRVMFYQCLADSVCVYFLDIWLSTFIMTDSPLAVTHIPPNGQWCAVRHAIKCCLLCAVCVGWCVTCPVSLAIW